MRLFDTTDPGVVAARPKFYITIVVLSLGKYVVAGLAYWLVRNRKQDGPDDPDDLDGPVPEGLANRNNSNNNTTSKPFFNSDGKEVPPRTSKGPADSARSQWRQLPILRWRNNYSAQKPTENPTV